MKRGPSAASILLLTLGWGLAAPSSAHGQTQSKWGVRTWELTGFFGGLADAVEFMPDLSADQFRRDAIFGGRLGYNWDSNVFVQVEGSNSLVRIVYPDPSSGNSRQIRNTNAFFGGASLGYNLQPRTDVQLFATVGGGLVLWGAELTQRELQPRFNYGVGLRYFFHPQIAVRSDARIHHVPGALETLRGETAGGPVPGETMFAGELSLGVSLFSHNSADRDGDGVHDEDDLCPGTRPGGIVDENGCEFDTDLDGVPDPLDMCPGTPQGARVDASGCPSDGDGDGVFDGIDECPGTRAGADVDERGCASDGDGDGVPDGLDECPQTPAGSVVNAEGCSEAELMIEAGRLILYNVYFDFNQVTLRRESQGSLDEVGAVLEARPQLHVEVQGHTDAIGSDAFNQTLSEGRASSVAAYLLDRFPSLRGRLSAVGYGESQPVASNDFVEGRQENRRVEFVVREGG